MPSRPRSSGSGSRRRAYVHIGLPKTGTSYLQNVFWFSREELEKQGVAFLPRRRGDHLRAVLAVRNMFQPFDNDFTRGALDRLSARAAEVRGDVLVSHESYAPARPERAQLLLDALGDFEFHVIVTVRDLGRQIPSAWQQRIQGRGTFEFEEFLAAVLDREPLASDFWWNQDLVDVLGRWSQVVPAERIHVITCPPSGAPRGLLLDRFCSVIGVDPDRLERDQRTSNVALGRAQAEFLRRVNLALGDRLPHIRDGYGQVAQTFLGERVLRPQAGLPAKLPESARGRLEELTALWKSFVVDQGFEVTGDLGELDLTDDAFEPVGRTVTDAELVDVAAAAVAEILVRRVGELDERAELSRRVEELEEQLAVARSRRGSMRNLTRRTAGRD